ncbi:MAG: lamin tail domain-containing protein, partial [Candidatus Latescibacteria bacterium]|nr:lamin tail domain-containing protein [Candidatus Latescibacterota bacterium]
MCKVQSAKCKVRNETRSWLCYLLCGMLMAAVVDTQAQVVINEVMYDPAGSEFFDEYVELYNAGETPVDLVGWRVG